MTSAGVITAHGSGLSTGLELSTGEIVTWAFAGPVVGGFVMLLDVDTPFDAEALHRLAHNQFGLVSASQLRQLGCSCRNTQHRVESGDWLAVLRGVYAITNGPLCRQMTLMAALLYGGTHAILSHHTAAEEWKMAPAADDAPVHITVPYGKSALPQQPRQDPRPWMPRCHAQLHPGVVVHRSRAHRHIGADGLFPRTTKADTAIDLAVAEPTARGAYVSLVASVTNGRIRLLDIRRRLELRRPYRYARAMADAVRMLADGVQSLLEFAFAVDVEQAHALPTACRQSPVVVDGRTLYEDCDYAGHGFPLIVRLDGRRAHSMREIAFRDRRRDNAAELNGKSRLVYGWEEVTRDPCGVAGEIEAVLVRHGWRREGGGGCAACARLSPLEV